ncbi:MAG TPA: carbonic anhydrase [Bryobacteraceae bacterium]|nr:carbonic anhydrase [Bryobacteraceae bacterium]
MKKIARRTLFRQATSGLLVSAISSAKADVETFRMPASPREAMTMLAQGNSRFQTKQLTSLKEDLQILRTNTVEEQKPFAAILSCADSRVPVELIFDQTIGHLFVVRVAGNFATPATIASLEYGAAVLGVKAMLVIGHRNCGAVKATMSAKSVPGQISSLYQYIHPALKAGETDANLASRENSKYQAGLLHASSPVLGSLIKEGKLSISAAYYDVETGKVEILT